MTALPMLTARPKYQVVSRSLLDVEDVDVSVLTSIQKGEQVHYTQKGNDMQINPGNKLPLRRVRWTSYAQIIVVAIAIAGREAFGIIANLWRIVGAILFFLSE